MTGDGFYYARSTIAQCAAALAALIGFFGLWRLDRLREEMRQREQEIVAVTISTKQDPPEKAQLFGSVYYLKLGRELAKDGHTELGLLYRQWDALRGARQPLVRVLIGFLTGMLAILVLAVSGFIFVDPLKGCTVTPWLIGLASICLGIGPAWVVWQAARYQEDERVW